LAGDVGKQGRLHTEQLLQELVLVLAAEEEVANASMWRALGLVGG
jgi:hypothetical protein